MTQVGRIVLVPGCLALRPRYASLHDPVAELRRACLQAVSWLGPTVTVLAEASGRGVAEDLLAARHRTSDAAPSWLVVANGSACRTEKAPGGFNPAAEQFDRALRAALIEPNVAALSAIDCESASRLLADVGQMSALADLLASARTVGVDYDDAPYGVQYWVLRWRG